MSSPTADTPAHGMPEQEMPDADALAQMAALLGQLRAVDTANVNPPVSELGLAERLDRIGLDPAPFDPAPFDPAPVDPAPVDPAPVERGLHADRSGALPRRAGRHGVGPADPVVSSAPVRALIGRGNAETRSTVLELVAEARLDVPSEVAGEDVARVVAFWQVLLARIGADGIELTADGDLPLVDEVALADALGGVDTASITGGVDGAPVVHLRHSAQRLGLVRLRHGRVVVSPDAWSVATDAGALWRLVAGRLPIGDDEAERDAGLLALLVLAGGATMSDPGALVASVMSTIGWSTGGKPVTAADATRLARPTIDALFPGWSAPADCSLLRALARYSLDTAR